MMKVLRRDANSYGSDNDTMKDISTSAGMSCPNLAKISLCQEPKWCWRGKWRALSHGIVPVVFVPSLSGRIMTAKLE